MKTTVSTSKKIGTVIINSHDSQYSIHSKNLEASSLNQDEEHYLIEHYSHLLGTPENISMFAESKVWSPEAVKQRWPKH